MSVGPMGMASSVSGSIPQTRNAEADKAQQQATEQARQTDSAAKAEQASGVGETEQDEQASDRDADGRRLWEANEDETHSEEPTEQAPSPQSKDPSGERGGHLDLSG